MRVALISDLHGNAVALRAALDHIRGARVDRVVCLGDVATLGPAPSQTLELLAELECPCIRGNHDDFLLDEALIRSYTDAPPVVGAVNACREGLNTAEREFVATFEHTLEMELDGATLTLFHGSPRSNTEDLLATTPAEQLDEALGQRARTANAAPGLRSEPHDERSRPAEPVVMAGGHTHIQMLRQHRGTLVVNPGSVGLAFEAYVHGGPPTILAHAEFAIVEAVRGAVSVTLCRIPLDKEALRASVRNWDNPLRPYLLNQYGG